MIGLGATRSAPVEFEVFGTSMGIGLIAGVLSVLDPFLEALAGTLAALSLAGWASMMRRRGAGRAALLRSDRLLALGLLAAGAAVYGFPTAVLAEFRGLVVALAVVPLWLTERRRPSAPDRPAGGA